MEFEAFYDIGEAFSKGAVRLSPIDVLLDENFLKNGDALPEVSFRYEEGEVLYDFISLSSGSKYLISEKCVSILEKHKITGWKSYAANLKNIDLPGINNYKMLAIKGRCGPINDNLSKYAVLPPYVPNGPEIKGYFGMLFEMESWDGSDIFSPKGMSGAYVTSKVKNIFEENNITNCVFLRITEIENFLLGMSLLPPLPPSEISTG